MLVNAGGACLSCFSSFFLAGAGQERALRKSETKINAELSDLDKNIIVKEALLAQIKDGQASYEAMQQVRGRERSVQYAYRNLVDVTAVLLSCLPATSYEKAWFTLYI